MAPLKRYPAGPITKAGAYHILNDRIPQMALRSYDDTVVFNLMGGLALAHRDMPERVEITSLKGLIPPWQKVTQKPATADGETFITSLYDPMEVDIGVRAKGRDPAHTRKVIDDWIASWDAIDTSELSFTTHDLGRWWAKVRWSKAPVDKWTGGANDYQEATWSAVAFDAFWRSYDDIDSFGFKYADDHDGFDSVTSEGLVGWTGNYVGDGGGYVCETNLLDILGVPVAFPNPGGGQAAWIDDPAHPTLSGGRTWTGRRDGFTSATVNQVVSIQIGSIPEWSFPDEAFNDIWARMPAGGTPGDEGIRLRFGLGILSLSSFVDGAEQVIRQQPLFIPPLPGEWWTLVAGYDGAERTYTVYRSGLGIRSALFGSGGVQVMSAVESGTRSIVDDNHKSCGMGLHAAPALITQATPATVLNWSAGDNTNTTQSGFVTRINAGDQPMYDRITCYGPGTFYLGDGPDATNFVEFGPLLPGQIGQLRTDVRNRGVVDLGVTPASPTAQTQFQQALEDLFTFAGISASPLAQSLLSEFGVAAPQGNLYKLLSGRFSKAAAIPKKPAGGPPPKYHVPVKIAGGNADSKVVYAGTPLRRFPY